MQSTLPHLQNQPNKKAKHDLSKKKSLCGRFLIFFNKDRQQSFMIVFNEWKIHLPPLPFFDWSYFSHIYLEMPFPVKSWGMMCASLVLLPVPF